MNIKLTIIFNGANFYGWQSQNGKQIAIQDVLQKAITNVYKNKNIIKIYGCSRTDRAVNAMAYVANFRAPFFIKEQNIVKAINYHLPSQIQIKNAEYVDDDFHARYNAKGKTYIYRVFQQQSPTIPVLFDDFCCVETGIKNFDFDKMKQIAKIFQGKHNFKAFSIYNKKNKKENYECEIFYINVRKKGRYIYFIIKADRFLHKMIRFIVGAILDFGKGKITETQLLRNLEAKERVFPLKPVTGNGLFLKRVYY